MLKRLICSAALLLGALAFSPLAPVQAEAGDGIVKFKSAYPMPETIARMKKDIADKGIKFFDEIDQSKLAADAGIKLQPSTLLVFGNPPLGTLVHHRQSRCRPRLAGAAARVPGRQGRGVGRLYRLRLDRAPPRHHQPQEEFKMASEVIGSITSTVKAK